MTSAQRRSQVSRPLPASSIDAREVEQFAALGQDWWDPNGPVAPLHRLNPLRLSFVRDVAVGHFGRERGSLSPFSGLSLVDVGCGGGLLAEPLARQGFSVTGIDAAAEAIAAASAHAAQTHPRPAYRVATAEMLEQEGAAFDVVVAMEIVEHVADRESFLRSCAALAKPGGLVFVATIARTLKALALAKLGAEYLLGWIKPGTHDWRKFVSPGALALELEGCGLRVLETRGVGFDPLAWDWRLTRDTDVNYMLAASKPDKNSAQ